LFVPERPTAKRFDVACQPEPGGVIFTDSAPEALIPRLAQIDPQESAPVGARSILEKIEETKKIPPGSSGPTEHQTPCAPSADTLEIDKRQTDSALRIHGDQQISWM